MIKLNHKDYHVPGIMVASASGSFAVSATSSGLGDVKENFSWPLQGRVLLGQVTETFTAALVLQCVKDFGLSLDSSLLQISRKFNADNGRLRLIVEEYNQLKPVTVRDLLQHTSGLPSYDQAEAYLYRMSKNPKKVWHTEMYLDLITGTDVEYSYGYWKAKRGEHSLSSTNYILLGVVLEAVTGRLVAELMTQLFEYYNLAQTAYAANGVIDKKNLGKLVHGYLPISFPYADIFHRLPVVTYNNSRELRAYDVTSAYNLHGLAGMAGMSSVMDMVHWVRLIWRDQVLGDPMSTFFEKPAKINRDGRKDMGEFGLGFRRAVLQPYGELVWSKGRVYGYETLIGYSLEKDVSFAIAVNSNRSPVRVLTGSDILDDVLTQILL